MIDIVLSAAERGMDELVVGSRVRIRESVSGRWDTTQMVGESVVTKLGTNGRIHLENGYWYPRDGIKVRSIRQRLVLERLVE